MIIPLPGRAIVLNELHEGHPGISRMKSLARTIVWWPDMDREIEERVCQCNECQRVQSSPPLAPLHSWEWPLKPWSRVHCDFAGPFLGYMFFVVIDAHSKWIEAHQMSSITSTVTIRHLRDIFSQHGLPETIVTENGTSFVSEEFKQFLEENGISHIRSSPYHP